MRLVLLIGLLWLCTAEYQGTTTTAVTEFTTGPPNVLIAAVEGLLTTHRKEMRDSREDPMSLVSIEQDKKNRRLTEYKSAAEYFQQVHQSWLETMQEWWEDPFLHSDVDPSRRGYVPSNAFRAEWASYPVEIRKFFIQKAIPDLPEHPMQSDGVSKSLLPELSINYLSTHCIELINKRLVGTTAARNADQAMMKKYHGEYRKAGMMHSKIQNLQATVARELYLLNVITQLFNLMSKSSSRLYAARQAGYSEQEIQQNVGEEHWRPIAEKLDSRIDQVRELNNRAWSAWADLEKAAEKAGEGKALPVRRTDLVHDEVKSNNEDSVADESWLSSTVMAGCLVLLTVLYFRKENKEVGQRRRKGKGKGKGKGKKGAGKNKASNIQSASTDAGSNGALWLPSLNTALAWHLWPLSSQSLPPPGTSLIADNGANSNGPSAGAGGITGKSEGTGANTSADSESWKRDPQWWLDIPDDMIEELSRRAEDTHGETYICPMSSVIMRHPVMLCESGITYEHCELHEWVVTKRQKTDPTTTEKIRNGEMRPNKHLARTIRKWCEDEVKAIASDRRRQGREIKEQRQAQQPRAYGDWDERDRVHIFVDDSNIFRGLEDGCVPDIPKLVAHLEGGQCVEERVVVGSSGKHNHWEKWKEARYMVSRDPRQGKEVFVDDALVAQLLGSAAKMFPPPGRILVLVTGDGNDNHGRVSFPEAVYAALRHQWYVRVYTWKAKCNPKYKVLAHSQPGFSLKYLDDTPGL
jgi:hypothetical protein